jgi:hypothetical protein
MEFIYLWHGASEVEGRAAMNWVLSALSVAVAAAGAAGAAGAARAQRAHDISSGSSCLLFFG